MKQSGEHIPPAKRKKWKKANNLESTGALLDKVGFLVNGKRIGWVVDRDLIWFLFSC